jgi:glycosyltransferase involved in cell wall biosynthesis
MIAPSSPPVSGIENGPNRIASKAPKLLFLVTEDWYFASHRLPLAVAAKQAGFEVAVACRVGRDRSRIEASGIRVLPLARFRRESTSPLSVLAATREITALYRRERPDIVHHVALKPVLLGSVAAWLAGLPRMVNAVAGLGWLFTSQSLGARLLGRLIARVFRLLLNRSQVIVQNPDDRNFLQRLGVRAGHLNLIRGAGVDMHAFAPRPEPEGRPLVILASRLLWNKGVGEFVDAARELHKQGIQARFALVGEPDYANPAAIPKSRLAEWQGEGVVEWWGRRDDMPQVLAQAHVVCLPSFYGEGIPKVLIEAAAAGRPIVTTDTPGCREIVRNGENGLLVPVKSAESLASALRSLIENPELRARMGQCGRKIAMAEFSLEKINAETLAVYQDLS